MHTSFGTIILTGMAIVALYAAFLFYSVYHSTQISKKIITGAVAYEQHPSHPRTRILVAGDSTAVGVGAADNRDSTAGRLGQQFPDADIINVAVSGYRLADVITVLEKQQGQHYDLMLLQIGANDVTHFTSSAIVTQEVEKAFSLCAALSSKTIVLTAGNIGASRVFYWPLSGIITKRTLMVRAIFLNTVSRYPSIAYIDLFRDKKNDPFRSDPKKYYAADSFHLTNEGYGIWYAAIQHSL